MFPVRYGWKSIVYKHFQHWSDAGVMAEVFACSLPNLGRGWCWSPMENSRQFFAISSDEGLLSKSDQQRTKRPQNPYTWGRAGPSLGNNVNRSNVHDSCLIGAILKSFHKMGECLWGLTLGERLIKKDKW